MLGGGELTVPGQTAVFLRLDVPVRATGKPLEAKDGAGFWEDAAAASTDRAFPQAV